MARFFKVQQVENSLLEYEEFVLRIKFIILNAKEKYKDVTDVTIYWEMVKMEISLGFSLFDSPKKKVPRIKEIRSWNFFENLRIWMLKLMDLQMTITLSANHER